MLWKKKKKEKENKKEKEKLNQIPDLVYENSICNTLNSSENEDLK